MIGYVARWMGLLTLSIVLSILPLPAQLTLLQPSWTLLLLFYMVLFTPLQWWLVLLVMGWVLDVMHADILGVHGFAFSLSLWMIAVKKERFNNFSLNQQMLWIGMACGCYEASLILLNVLLSEKIGWMIGVASLMKIFIGMILWPWLKVFLDEWLSFSKRSH